MMMDNRRDFLITGDGVGVLKMFTNTMEEMWSSAKHKCAVRSIAISSTAETFASGDVSFEVSLILKITQSFRRHMEGS